MWEAKVAVIRQTGQTISGESVSTENVEVFPAPVPNVEDVLATTRAARDQARQIGLKFEAYLLHMAALSLFEQLQRRKR